MILHSSTVLNDIEALTDREAIADMLHKTEVMAARVEALRPRNPTLFFVARSLINLRYDLAMAKEAAK